jgi:hypothetical protein
MKGEGSRKAKDSGKDWERRIMRGEKMMDGCEIKFDKDQRRCIQRRTIMSAK